MTLRICLLELVARESAVAIVIELVQRLVYALLRTLRMCMRACASPCVCTCEGVQCLKACLFDDDLVDELGKVVPHNRVHLRNRHKYSSFLLVIAYH